MLDKTANLNNLSGEHEEIRISLQSILTLINQQFERVEMSMKDTLNSEQLQYLEERWFDIHGSISKRRFFLLRIF